MNPPIRRPAGKTVLMVCYAYPPIRAAGSIRNRAFSSRLKQLGWDPIVLSVSNSKDTWTHRGEPVPENVRVVRTPEWDLHGLVEKLQAVTNRIVRQCGGELDRNYYRELLCIPDAQIAWFSSFRGVRLAKVSDVIYVSCSPFSSVLSGCLMKALSRRPLVLDFRDAWTLNPYNQHVWLHDRTIQMMERVALAVCDRLIVNTAGAEALYKRKYPQWRHKILSIPNGYETLDIAPRLSHSDAPFKIVHVGTFYGSRGPETLLDVLKDLKNPNIEFIQVGPTFPCYAAYKDSVNIRLIGSVPNEQARALMKTASLLYLKQGFEPGVTDYIAVASKTYEYFATGLPVLAECPRGDNADLVAEYASQSFVVTTQSYDDLRTAVERAYAQRAATVPAVKKEFVEQFDRTILTQRLISVFENVVAGQHILALD